jgi:biuret amidohydrolase
MSANAVAAAGPVSTGPAGADRLLVAGTEPYPWPYDGRFSARRCALLVISDGGLSEPTDADADTAPDTAPDTDADAVVRELVGRAQAAGVLVVGVATGRPPRGSSILAGPAPAWWAGPMVTAAGWDGFYGSPLDDVLRGAGRSQLLLAGRLLETGVHSTLRSANDRGYECLTIGDACAAYSPATARGALSSITMSGGIFGAIGTAAGVLAALEAARDRLCPSQLCP